MKKMIKSFISFLFVFAVFSTLAEIQPEEVEYVDRLTIDIRKIEQAISAKNVEIVVQELQKVSNVESISIIFNQLSKVNAAEMNSKELQEIMSASYSAIFKLYVKKIDGGSYAKQAEQLKWYQYDGSADFATGLQALMTRAKVKAERGENIDGLYYAFIEMVRKELEQ